MGYSRLKSGWLAGKKELHITSPFGPRKFKNHSYHYGVDISVPVGTNIFAPFSGKLTAMGIGGGGAGLYCTLQSGNIKLVFMHLSWCSLGERRGSSSSVSEGQLIAKTGGKKGDRLAGSSTGPHLHFEYVYNGKHINPVYVLSERLVGKVNKNIISRGSKSVNAKPPTKPIDNTPRHYRGEQIITNYPGNYDPETNTIDKGWDINAAEYKRGYSRENGGGRVAYSSSESELGDGNPMEEVEINDADIAESLEWSESYYTDVTATEDVPDVPKETIDGKASGIWQIVKLAMDGNVADKMLFDASISSQTGSILGFFNKACQKPLVEFSGDTFGDQYYFLVRRPPFDKDGMIKALNTQHLFDNSVRKYEKELENIYQKSGYYDFGGRWEDEGEAHYNLRVKRWKEEFKSGSKFWQDVQQLKDGMEDELLISRMYLIDNSDIINSNISFNNENIYSWYQFYPQYELAGDKMQYIVPAVLFPEYAAIWGSRPLQIHSQYASFRGLGTRDAQRNGLKDEVSDKRCRSVLDDLKYLIESNAYNPFVRQGTLTIIGTRRIRRGMFIEVCLERGVPEIFYVDSVSHSYSVNSNNISDTTTLQLSHGMVKRYIKESNKESGEISYFDLIDFTDYEKNRNNMSIDNWREVISKWKVNKDAFTFFLQKKQFIKGFVD